MNKNAAYIRNKIFGPVAVVHIRLGKNTRNCNVKAFLARIHWADFICVSVNYA